MDIRRLVGRNVRRLRKEKGHRNPTLLSLHEIAQALGVEAQALLAPEA